MPPRSDFVVVANRLPVRRVKRDALYEWETSPGGLVSALMPVLRGQAEVARLIARGAWIGWNGSTSSDMLDPFDHDGIRNVPLPISRKELAGYYEGIANSSIWPLYHDAIRAPTYRRRWWPDYEAVNERFAEAAAAEAARNAVVWVHDYHLHLVPRMLRERRPDLRIGFFLHIPFPGRGLFAQLPWRKQIVEGTLGADVIGFQTVYAARNFIDLATWFGDAKRVRRGVDCDGRHVKIDGFPISIDFNKFDEIAQRPEVRERAARYRQRLGDRHVLLGVDRMDYTKGIDVRLRALHELFKRGVLSIENTVLIQSAVPTRERVSDYAELRSTVEELVGQINGEFGEVGLVGVQYLRQNLPIDELVALYVAADVMLVTPFRDGMNLVAKEFIASKSDNSGRLVLSEFTGAANELKQAILVNPHDLDALANAIDDAVHMDDAEARRRMRSLRGTVRKHDVYDWANSFLRELAA